MQRCEQKQILILVFHHGGTYSFRSVPKQIGQQILIVGPKNKKIAPKVHILANLVQTWPKMRDLLTWPTQILHPSLISAGSFA